MQSQEVPSWILLTYMHVEHVTHSGPSYPSLTLPEAPPLSSLLFFLEQMILIRRIEERIAQIYTMGKIGGFCHLCIGQEAVPVASAYAMKPSDTMITAYRSHGHALVKGVSPRALVAELMGKYAGSSKGKGGSMHLFCKEQNFYGGHGIVGAQTSLGTGIAFAHKYMNDGGVCLTFLGDGASNQGQFFESMNMASLWDLPVLYIIENNGYGMGTSVQRACAGTRLYARGEPFNIPGHILYGDDVIQLCQNLSAAIEYVRHHQRPLLLEINTYRFKGHSMSDPGKYRTRNQLEEARTSRDPIETLLRFLKETNVPETDIKACEERALAAVEDAMTFGEETPAPPLHELYEDIYI